MRTLKLQSAMEYLMTYGWAILIIAVVMVALFSLGILGGSPLSTTCLPQSGYQCSSVIYHGGQLQVTVGQTTGNNWAVANIFFVPQGTGTNAQGNPSSIQANGYAGTSTTGASIVTACAPGCGDFYGNTISSGLNSGGTSALFLDASGVNYPPGSNTAAPATGSTQSGTIWAVYWIGTAGPYYAQMATITMKAV